MRRHSYHAALLLIVVALVGATAMPVRAAAGVLDELKARFNADKGIYRLVVLVSPTCPQCTSGATWIQEYILQRNPKLDVKVYAVWYEMYPGDSPKAFPEARTLLGDKRVTHYWDQAKDVGRWFHGLVPSNVKGEIEWDAFYLYSPDTVWTDRPAMPLTWGRTILKDRHKLLDQVAQLPGASAPGVQPGAQP
jgi:hypothetical protein